MSKSGVGLRDTKRKEWWCWIAPEVPAKGREDTKEKLQVGPTVKSRKTSKRANPGERSRNYLDVYKREKDIKKSQQVPQQRLGGSLKHEELTMRKMGLCQDKGVNTILK